MYELVTSSADTDDLSIGFDRDRGRRRDELTNKNNIKGKYHNRNLLKDVFGVAEHQDKALCGLGYKSTLTRSKDEAVLDKVVDIADARVQIDVFHW